MTRPTHGTYVLLLFILLGLYHAGASAPWWGRLTTARAQKAGDRKGDRCYNGTYWVWCADVMPPPPPLRVTRADTGSYDLGSPTTRWATSLGSTLTWSTSFSGPVALVQPHPRNTQDYTRARWIFYPSASDASPVCFAETLGGPERCTTLGEVRRTLLEAR